MFVTDRQKDIQRSANTASCLAGGGRNLPVIVVAGFWNVADDELDVPAVLQLDRLHAQTVARVLTRFAGCAGQRVRIFVVGHGRERESPSADDASLRHREVEKVSFDVAFTDAPLLL